MGRTGLKSLQKPFPENLYGIDTTTQDRFQYHDLRYSFGSDGHRDGTNTPPTTEIRKGDELIFLGHVLAISEKTISVYDPATQQVRTLPMDGLEIQHPIPEPNP